MIKLFKLSLVVICAGLIITSCKKKDNKTDEPASTTGSTATPTVAPETHFIPTDYNDANGMLNIMNIITKTTNGLSWSVSSSTFGNAKFTTVPNNFTNLVGAGTLSLNATVCSLQSDSSYSNFNLFLTNTAIANWRTNGYANVPAFNFSVGTPTVVTPNNDLQINKAAGYVFNFSNITNKDSVSVLIQTQFTSTITASTVEKKYLYSAGSASFSPSELSALPTGTCDIIVKCTKYAKDTVAGKYFYYINNTSFKQNVIVN